MHVAFVSIALAVVCTSGCYSGGGGSCRLMAVVGAVLSLASLLFKLCDMIGLVCAFKFIDD